MKINTLLLKKAAGITAVAAITAQLLIPAISSGSPVAAYSVNDETKTVTYTFEDGSFADGIKQNSSAIKIDGTSSELTFTDTAVANISGKKAANSSAANVVGLPNGTSRSSGKKYSSSDAYPALAEKHNNVLRLGANGSEGTVSGGVLLNNGETVLTLKAGKYIIGFDYYATNAAKLEIINNVKSVNKTDGVTRIGDKYNSVDAVLNGGDTVIGSWQTVARTVEIKKSANIGLYVTGLDGELFLDNITVSTVSTVCFDADCDVLPISGKPGTEVTLPDEEDVVVSGKRFEGWYTDAEFTVPVKSLKYALPTNELKVTLYAKMAKVQSAETVADFNFDEGNYKDFKTNTSVDGVKVSGGAYSIVDSVEGASGRTLRIYTPDGQSRHLAFNNGSKWFTLEPGQYTVSYKYMVKDRRAKKDGAKLLFVKNLPFDSTAWSAPLQGTAVSQNLFDLDDAGSDGSWQTGSADISITDDENVNFGIRQDNLYFDVYLDDIIITKQAAKTVTVSFETNGGSVIAPIKGVSGTKLSTEIPTKSGFRFGGWFTDVGLTNKADVFFPQNDAVYYAKWLDSTIKITFDGDFKTGNIAGVLVGGGMFNMAGAPDNADNKTLVVGGVRNLYDGAGRAMKFNDGKEFLSLDAGDHVEITYKYYIKDRQGDSTNTKGNFKNYRANIDNPQLYFIEGVTGNTAGSIDGTKSAEAGKSPVQLLDVKNGEANKWHTGTLTIDIKKGGVVGIIAAYVWADVYFDDFELKVTKPRQVTISFDSQGGSDCENITAGAGFSFSLPTPTREGYNFGGWYTKPNGDGTRASATAPQENITYYAKWVSKDTVIIDFENGLKPGHVNNVGSSFFTEGESNDEHGKVMLYKPTNDLSRPRMMTDDAKVLPNTDYIISFEYNIRSLPSSGGFEFDFATNLHDVVYLNYDRIAGRNLLSDARPDNTAVVGKWRRTSVIIHTPDNVGNGYLAAFATNGTGAEIWFDNMEITRVDNNSDPVLFIDYGYDGLTEIKHGKAGEKYVLGIPTSAGYTFEGWTDENGNEISEITYPAHGVVYAYAMWFNSTPHVVTFDDMPENLSTNGGGRFVTAVCFGIADGKGQNGTKALKYSNGSAQWKYTAMNEGKSNFNIKKNKTYKVKVHYFRENNDGSVSLQFATANPGSWFGDRVEQTSAVKIKNDKGSWQELTMFMTAKNDGALYLGIFGNSKAVVYFDNIEISEMSRNDVIITYTSEQTAESWYVVGRKGEPINSADIPVINPKNYSFAGWYTDKDFTNEFKGTVFPAKSMTVYAKLIPSPIYVIDFTDYPYEGDTTSSKISASVMSISRGGPSSDGDGCSLLFDNTTEKQTTESKRILLGAGTSAMPLQVGVSYLIYFDYYIEKGNGGALTVQFASSYKTSMFSSFNLSDSGSQSAKFDLKKKKTWYTAAYAATFSKATADDVLAGMINVSLDSKVYIDNIRVKAIDNGYSALVFSSLIGNPPDPKIVKTGTTVKLPNMGDVDNFKFIGWRNPEENEIMTENTFTVTKTIGLSAEHVVGEFTEGFEDTKYAYEFGKGNYESDWEIYDSAVSGNSKDNVHSGKRSLHRIGKEPSFKAYSIHSNEKMSIYTLSCPMSYTVSMWVKIENPVHKLGAIEIMDNTRPIVPWASEGERYAIAAIADIADGKWHEISFTFKSVSHYLSIVTPGNLSIYIDDITIKYVGDKESDKSVMFEEYIPRFLNPDGTYSAGDASNLAAYSIVNGKGPEGNAVFAGFTDSVLFVTIIVCGAAVLTGVLGCMAVIIIKKKKGGK